MRPLSAAGLVALLALPAAAAAQGAPGPAPTVAATAWAALDEGRHADAAEGFAAAIALEPRDPSLYYGAGRAAFLLGDPEAARGFLERALALAPGFTAAALTLGEVLYRTGDTAGAARVLEAARARDPGNEALAARAGELRAELDLQRNFFQSPGAHFTVLFEGPADEALARRALDVLENAYWRIATALATFPDRVVPVVLYTEEQFSDVSRSPGWAAAMYDGRIRVPMRGALDQPEELERVLTHEAAHAFIRTLAPAGVPTWLNEGLAVAFEPNGVAWAEAELAGASARLPFARLDGGFGDLSAADSRLAYAQSAVAAQALLDLVGPTTVVALLRDIARGEAFPAAFERRALLPYEFFVERVDAGAERFLR